MLGFYVRRLIQAGIILPAFVFAQNSFNEDLKMMEEQMNFRQQVEEISYAVTQNLCDAFVLRQKYGMGLYPDPVSETYNTTVVMSGEEASRYYTSLYQWLKIGHKGVLENWGFSDGPAESDPNFILFSRSRFTKTLVITRGFYEAAKNCGELNAKKLSHLLFEQENTQAALSFIVLPAIVAKGVFAVGKASWPLLRSTLFGRTLIKVPWSKVGVVAFTALGAYIGYGVYHDLSKNNQEDTASLAVQKTEEKIKLDSIHDALMRWFKNRNKNNEDFKKSESYLLANQNLLKELQSKYESDLEAIGEAKLQEIVQKFVQDQNNLNDQERATFMKAAAFANLKLFNQIY